MVDVGPPNGYVREGKKLRKIRRAGDLQLVYQASSMRQERTGFHAKIEILAEGVVVAYNTFNVERDPERVTLANSAYKQIAPGPRQELPSYPQKYLKNDLDAFCAGLQDAFVEGQMPKRMSGSVVRREPRFILKPYILRGGSTILFAPPGQGKSYVLWLMAVCIDAGLDPLWPVEQAKVLVVNLERSEDSVADRLGNINEALHLSRTRPLHVLNARGRTLEAMAPAIERYIEREGIEVVLLDSMSRAGKGSLIDDDVVNAYCDILNGFECAWLALAHSPRADTSHVFGSQMFDAAADLMVKLDNQSRSNGTMGVSLDVTKRNDIGPQPLWIGSFAFDSGGLTAARRALPGEFSSLEGGQALPPEERVIKYLTRVGRASATEVADNLSLNRTNVSHMFHNNDRFVVVERKGKEVLYGVAASTGTTGRVAHTMDQGNTFSGQHEGNTFTDEELPF